MLDLSLLRDHGIVSWLPDPELSSSEVERLISAAKAVKCNLHLRERMTFGRKSPGFEMSGVCCSWVVFRLREVLEESMDTFEPPDEVPRAKEVRALCAVELRQLLRGDYLRCSQLTERINVRLGSGLERRELNYAMLGDWGTFQRTVDAERDDPQWRIRQFD